MPHDDNTLYDDGTRFYHRVAEQAGQPSLTLAQGQTAFAARLAAIQSFERRGPTTPFTGAGLIYRLAWVTTQNQLFNAEGTPPCPITNR